MPEAATFRPWLDEGAPKVAARLGAATHIKHGSTAWACWDSKQPALVLRDGKGKDHASAGYVQVLAAELRRCRGL